MVIFNSYVKLPEGTEWYSTHKTKNIVNDIPKPQISKAIVSIEVTNGLWLHDDHDADTLKLKSLKCYGNSILGCEHH